MSPTFPWLYFYERHVFGLGFSLRIYPERFYKISKRKFRFFRLRENNQRDHLTSLNVNVLQYSKFYILQILRDYQNPGYGTTLKSRYFWEEKRNELLLNRSFSFRS